MKPTINDSCIGCGACEGTCPDVFKLDSAKASVIEGVDYDSKKECIESAAAGCPVQAISIEE